MYTWCHTVDGRIVNGIETEKVKCYAHTEPLKFTQETTRSWTHEREETTNWVVGDEWRVPNFFENLTNSIESWFSNNEQREVRYNFA